MQWSTRLLDALVEETDLRVIPLSPLASRLCDWWGRRCQRRWRCNTDFWWVTRQKRRWLRCSRWRSISLSLSNWIRPESETTAWHATGGIVRWRRVDPCAIRRCRLLWCNTCYCYLITHFTASWDQQNFLNAIFPSFPYIALNALIWITCKNAQLIHNSSISTEYFFVCTELRLFRHNYLYDIPICHTSLLSSELYLPQIEGRRRNGRLLRMVHRRSCHMHLAREVHNMLHKLTPI